jgi:chromosome segregation ATPase
MTVVLLILIAVGALISLAAAVRALRAYLGYRRARAAFQSDVTAEVARLAERTGELESGLSALDARAAALPIQISELQQSLTSLRVLTGALSASLRQVQRVLSYGAIKTLSAARLGRLLRLPPLPKSDGRPGGPG